jgi:hypothetical protein
MKVLFQRRFDTSKTDLTIVPAATPKCEKCDTSKQLVLGNVKKDVTPVPALMFKK